MTDRSTSEQFFYGIGVMCSAMFVVWMVWAHGNDVVSPVTRSVSHVWHDPMQALRDIALAHCVTTRRC